MAIDFSIANVQIIKKRLLALKKNSKLIEVLKLGEQACDRFEKSVIVPDFEKICKPIKDKKEYLLLLNKLKNCLTNSGLQKAYFTDMDELAYKHADIMEIGLVPYCGIDDSSRIINKYLSGMLTKEFLDNHFYSLPSDIETLSDVVRVMEYSLKYLDNKYGTYSGIVYRQGPMSEYPSRYISTTLDYEFVSLFRNYSAYFQPNRQYSVIKLMNGHKIFEFQKQQIGEVGELFAKKEQEVLAPFKSEYKKLSENELTQDLSDAKVKLASSFFVGAESLFNGEKTKVNDYTKKDLLNMIDVFVQQR